MYILVDVRDRHFSIPKTPKYRKSASWTTEVLNIGISGLRPRQQKNLLCSLYIKASEVQCRSVYYWSSLGRTLFSLSTTRIATIYNYIKPCSLLQCKYSSGFGVIIYTQRHNVHRQFTANVVVVRWLYTVVIWILFTIVYKIQSC